MWRDICRCLARFNEEEEDDDDDDNDDDDDDNDGDDDDNNDVMKVKMIPMLLVVWKERFH